MLMANDAMDGKLNRLVDMAGDLYIRVRQAADDGTPMHEVEKAVFEQLLAMGHHILGVFLSAAGSGDLGESLAMPDGHRVNRLDGLHRREYKSVFGTFELERAVYGSREGQAVEFVPLDARLHLPGGKFSYMLQDWAQSLSVEHAFAKTCGVLERILGIGLCVDSLEQMSRDMASNVAAFRQSRPAPAPQEEGQILVATADNKGIPMRRPADHLPLGARRKKGEKANKKQMAAVGGVYTVDPKPRTPEELVALLFRENAPAVDRASPEPVAQHKRFYSSLSLEHDGQIIRGEASVFAWMEQEVVRRHRPGQPVVCLMDGQKTLWDMAQTHFDCLEHVEILDLLHAMSRIWEAAHVFHAEGSDAASNFARERCLRLLRGEAVYVIAGLRQMATKHKLRGAKLQRLRSTCNYLENNVHRMRYDEYLAAGYPIASGVIEGACRYVVKDRMERSGMRWTTTGAQAMLDLRTTYVNGQWQEFQQYRIHAECERIYPQHKLLETIAWPMAA